VFCNVFLFDILGVVPFNLKMTVNTTLQNYFNQVTAFNNNIDTVLVSWPGGTPGISSTDILVYFLDFGHTLMNQVSGGHSGIPSLDGTGATWPHPPATLSEMYMSVSDGVTLANVTFHECMHNKLQLDDSMHNNDGLRKGAQQGGLGPNDTISNGNIQDMAPVISSSVPQFTAGIGILTSAVASQAAGDPLWDNGLK
jgi:hypothetical protein